ncbi:hypothetical protein CIB95_04520 [Lottiidibacillus patelloidae]|uniref:Membrane protein YqhR n=1 Tax=Lottiidibacillus patelloidae TaxID=2670334 RepID=A0A263BV61_9BACI|nr:YqhR family membrane protein [Lottiidibacillus patelloidae]OZM57641.1 hypothetical protein CIB95_04520 [Lottiidibacillus patelloidae]
MAKEKLEQNQQEQPMSPLVKAMITGVVGGIFWSLLGYVAYIFSFTKLGPALVLQPWAVGDWKTGVLGQFIGIVAIGVLSIPVALIYKGLFSKIEGMWLGIVYGVGLWALVFFIFNPLFQDLKSVKELGWSTNITTICLYILYGVFIGYSISFDYKEMNREKSSEMYSN